MRGDVLMAGFGGQGMLLAGKILAQAAMDLDLEVSWLPSYGPEMRGGTANVIVRISPEPIASPLVSRPGNLLVMNLHYTNAMDLSDQLNILLAAGTTSGGGGGTEEQSLGQSEITREVEVRGATEFVRTGTNTGGRTTGGSAAEDPARSMLALTGHTIEFTDDDSRPGHLTLTGHGNQGGTCTFDTLFFRFETHHESRFIRQGNDRQMKGICQLQQSDDFFSSCHVGRTTPMPRIVRH